MEFDNLFLIALQGSLVLGVIHGINPCGHSWLVLAPFVTGNKDGRQVSLLTLSFILGTATACIAIGWSLGSISSLIGSEFRYWTDTGANIIIIVLGLLLLVKPHALHHHHDEPSGSCAVAGNTRHEAWSGQQTGEKNFSLAGRITITGLFTIGFVNMIVPCPTAAMMYSYALESASVWRSTAVFGVYALGTGVTVAAVIYGIYKITGLIRRLNQDWLEDAFMRTVGLLTVAFGSYSLLS
ncbi:MAG: sulfite exporter TauE/SafE family protein [Desulfurivibrionaceae bacterium]